MARIDTLEHFLTDVADAIREKTGDSDLISANDFDTEIENIPSGGGVDINDYFLTQPTEAVSLGTTWLKQIPTFDCSLLTTMAGLFSSCDFLGHTLKVSCNDSITSLYRTFYYTVNAETIDLSLCNTSNVTSMQDMFRANSNPYDTTVKNIIFGSNFTGVKTTTTIRMFQNRRGLTVIDLSNFETTNKLLNTQYMFAQCINLTKIDMRKMYLNNVIAYDNMFQNIPNNCEIIVKDDTQKTWITSKFTSLTNVKTVAEYEAE